MRQLVVHTGGIGDFLLACPAIIHLSWEGPVELAGRKGTLGLAVQAGIAQAAHDLDAIDFGSVFSSPSPRLREFLATFDRAVVWMHDSGEIQSAFRDSGIDNVRCFPGLPPDDWSRHASQYYLDCLDAPGAPPLRLDVQPSDEAHDVVIHPGSGGTWKNWPRSHYEALTRRLSDSGRPVAWCLGPAEESIEAPAGVEVLREAGLPTLVKTLAAANAYIGNDSGITHLAAAVGCPCVALFGPTDPTVWAPRGEHVHVMHIAPWPGDPDDVTRQIQAALRATHV